MKIAYISLTSFSDCDMPLIKELISQGVDITYYMIMSDRTKKGGMINIDEVKASCGILPASEYPALANLSPYIDLSKVKVANMVVAHSYALSTFRLAYKLKKELQKQNFDLIHLTWPLDYPFYQLFTLRIPFVMTVHDPIPHSNDETIRDKFKRWATFKRTDRFILLNNTQKEEFENRYNIKDANVRMSRLGMYTHLQDVPIQPSIVDGDYILFAGTILPYKGLRYIVEAMNGINKSHKDIKLVVAGKGTPDFDIHPYVESGQVILINRFITNEEMSSLIYHSKFVCCPYKDATQSGVVMSAFALYKPVLATKVGAMHETIVDERHGKLVAPCDSKALTEAAKALLTGDTLERMSENIRWDYSKGDRSWKSIAQGTIEVYEIATIQ